MNRQAAIKIIFRIPDQCYFVLFCASELVNEGTYSGIMYGYFYNVNDLGASPTLNLGSDFFSF